MRAGRKNPDETRRQLLGAADRAFYGDGIRNASVDDIAEQAGVTKRTLYYHYGSKEDLVVAYLEARGVDDVGRIHLLNGPGQPRQSEQARHDN